MAGWRSSYWRPYVSVSQRRAQAARKAKQLAKKGHRTEPVVIEGRAIAGTFWGKAWCENLERYSDFENRLPRGRTYVRNGSVIDLRIAAGRVTALVSGSEIYTVKVDFKAAARARWQRLKGACAGKIDSLVELLQGRFSEGVMGILTAREGGLFPEPGEIEMDCSCPDWADMCKHVAAVLYGIGSRLDVQPELLFVLRKVDHGELITKAARASLAGAGAPAADGVSMEASEMEKIFGIELEKGAASDPGSAGRGRRTSAVAAARGKTPPRPGGAARRLVKEPASKREGYRAKVDLLTVRRALLQEHFVASDTLTSAEYRALFRVTAAAASRELKRLADACLVIQRGRKRGTRYFAGVELF